MDLMIAHNRLTSDAPVTVAASLPPHYCSFARRTGYSSQKSSPEHSRGWGSGPSYCRPRRSPEGCLQGFQNTFHFIFYGSVQRETRFYIAKRYVCNTIRSKNDYFMELKHQWASRSISVWNTNVLKNENRSAGCFICWNIAKKFTTKQGKNFKFCLW